MAELFSKPFDQMTAEEVRAWKDRLLAAGKRPRPFAWERVSESEYHCEPALNKVIERAADGKRYIVRVRNDELQRLQES